MLEHIGLTRSILTLFLLTSSFFLPFASATSGFAPAVGCSQFHTFPVCSGKGVCVLEVGTNITVINEANVPGSKCVCDPGWTGINDFVNMDTHDCGQSIVAIRAIWVFVLITDLVGLGVVAYKLWESYQAWLERPTPESETITTLSVKEPTTPRERRSTVGERHSEWMTFLRWPVVNGSLQALVSCSFTFIASLIRISNPEAMLGVSLLFTIFGLSVDLSFVMAEKFLSFAWLGLQTKLVHWTSQDEERSTQTIRRLERVLYFSFLTDWGRVIIGFMCYPFQTYAHYFCALYYQLVVFAIAIASWTFVQAGRSLEAILNDGLENLKGVAKEEREHALKNIGTVIKQKKQAVYLSLPVSLLLAWWPFLRVHGSYGFYQSIFPPLVLSSQIWILNPPRHNVQHKRKGTNAGMSTRGSSNDEENREKRKNSHQPLQPGNLHQRGKSKLGEDDNLTTVDTMMTTLTTTVEIEGGGILEKEEKQKQQDSGGTEMKIELTGMVRSTSQNELDDSTRPLTLASSKDSPHYSPDPLLSSSTSIRQTPSPIPPLPLPTTREVAEPVAESEEGEAEMEETRDSRPLFNPFRNGQT